MKTTVLIMASCLTLAASALAGVSINDEAFAKSLGGWKKANTYADYALSGADYRTYKPEISPTPDGGIFVSVRIDHLRGWLASNDHANLEITINSKGMIVSAQSTIAIQGQSIASDVIQGGNQAGNDVLNPTRAVQIGTDLVSNLTAKLLRENIVEAGRVSFPAVLRHNYNRLFQSIMVEGVAIPTATIVPGEPIVLPPPAPQPGAPAPAVSSPAQPVPPATPPVVPPAQPGAPETATKIAPPPAPAAAPAAPPAEAPKPAEPAKPDPASPLEVKPYGAPAADLPVPPPPAPSGS